MKISSKKVALLFSTLFVIISFTYTSFLLDAALVGRYVALSLFLIILLLFQTDSDKSIKGRIDPVFIIYIVYVIFNFVSAFWALNPGESIFESSKIFLGFIVFVYSVSLLRSNEFIESYIDAISKPAIV